MTLHLFRRRKPHDDDLGDFFDDFDEIIQSLLSQGFEVLDHYPSYSIDLKPTPDFVISTSMGDIAGYLCFADDIPRLLDKLKDLMGDNKNIQIVIATPDWLEPDELNSIPSAIRLIDCREIISLGFIPRSEPGEFSWCIRYLQHEAAHGYAAELKRLPHGRKMASAYEDLVRNVLIFIFNPKISLAVEQSRDLDGIKIRDLIFRIESPYNGWGWIAQYVAYSMTFVVEAKNLKDAPSADEIRQISDYLKPHGVGMFGIIVSRKKITPHTFKGVVSRRSGGGEAPKTIVPLCDEDILNLLDFRKNGHTERCDHYIRKIVEKIFFSVS